MAGLTAEQQAWLERIRWDEDGFVPVIIQDAAGGEVLTLAYADREALERALVEGTTWLYSRSRKRLWRKGERSGHSQRLLDVRYDCDADAVLYRVAPSGPACHTGERSCFHAPSAPGYGHGMGTAFLRVLEETIERRKADAPEGSYVVGLLKRGRDRILQKVGEEAVEVVLAGKNGEREAFVYEAADLVFHLTVALREQGLGWSDVTAELERRHR